MSKSSTNYNKNIEHIDTINALLNLLTTYDLFINKSDNLEWEDLSNVEIKDISMYCIIQAKWVVTFSIKLILILASSTWKKRSSSGLQTITHTKGDQSLVLDLVNTQQCVQRRRYRHYSTRQDRDQADEFPTDHTFPCRSNPQN